VTALPLELERQLARFSGESWRERKQAVKDLQAELEQRAPPAPVLAALVERLLDGLVAESVPARSTCHEMLVYLGPIGLPGALARLRQGGRGARMYVDLLADVGGDEQVPLLARILETAEDDNVRASAAAALGALGGPAAERALKAALAGASDMLQLFALDALRSIGAALPVDAILPLVDNAVTRRAATSLLAHSATPEALTLLVALLRDSMPGVRAAAAVALVTLDNTLADQGQPDAVASALADGRPGAADDDLRRRTRELVDHRQTEVRIAALELCRMTRDTGALRHVLPAMSDPVVRERAAGFVASLGPDAAPALAALADDLPPAVLDDFFVLVGVLGPGVADPASLARLHAPLVAGLEHPDPATACAAAAALGRLGDAASFAPLARALADEGPLGEAAAAALASVAQRSGPGAPALQALLRGASTAEGARARNLCRVLGALGRSGGARYVPPLVALLGSADAGVRVAAVRALGLIGGEHEGVTALCLALVDPEPTVRAGACRSLGQLGASVACPSLLAATDDESPPVRAAAVQALVALDNPVARPRLREIVLEDCSPAVVIHAIAGLGRSGGDLDLTLLMSLCRSTDHEVAKAAARALVRYPAHRATAAVLGLLDHERWDVRWAAAEVLAERGDVTALAPLRRVHAVEPDPLVRQVLAGAVARLEGLATHRAEQPL
jgi:HEAT repeat protein